MSGVLQALLASGTGFTLDAQAISASDLATDPADAQAVVSIDAGGAVTTTSVGGDFDMVVDGDPAALEIFVTTVSGTVTTGTVDAWTALAGASWTKTRASVGSATFSGTYAVRIAATGVVLASGVSFTMTAEVV